MRQCDQERDEDVMITHNTTMKIAYEFIKQHDPRLADTLCSDVKRAADNLQIANDRKCEREDEYNASVWQRLTQDREDVLRQFNYDLKDAQLLYGAGWDGVVQAVDDMHNENNSRKESEVESGNFVYYIVDMDTNVRKSENGVPVIYSTVEAAEWDFAEEFDTVISIAEYNRRYAAFMED